MLAPAIALAPTGEGWRLAFLMLSALGFAWCLGWSVLPGTSTIAGTREAGRHVEPAPKLSRLLLDPTVIGVTLCGLAASWLLTLAVVWLRRRGRRLGGLRTDRPGAEQATAVVR